MPVLRQATVYYGANIGDRNRFVSTNYQTVLTHSDDKKTGQIILPLIGAGLAGLAEQV